MTAPGRRLIAAVLAVLCVAAALAATRPRVERRWAVYTGTAADAARASGGRLVLEPYPDAVTCALAAAQIAKGGSYRVFCRSRAALALGAPDSALAATFAPGGAFALYAAFCARIARRVAVESSRSARGR